MVESVSNGGKVSDLSLAPVAAAAPVKPVASEVSAPAVDTASSTAKTMASSAPVDADRVRRIKAAVEAGNFPLSPATIADRLIALRYEWMSNDPA